MSGMGVWITTNMVCPPLGFKTKSVIVCLGLFILTYQAESRRLHLVDPSRVSLLPKPISPQSSQKVEQLAAISQQVVRNRTGGGEEALPVAGGLSVIAQSLVTFFTVFIFGCTIILAVLTWKKLSDPTFRVPLPYQYSALSQFDQDPDDDVNEVEDNLHMLVEDSSSEGDNDDDVFHSGSNVNGQARPKLQVQTSMSSNENEPATLALSENTESRASRDAATSNGRPKSVSSLLDCSDDEDLIK